MNIVVTGAAGFIGSHVSAVLAEQGHRVWGIDNFDKFYQRSIKESNLKKLEKYKNWDFLNGDICKGALEQIPASNGEIDVVLHLAGKAGVRPSIESPGEYVETNVKGTLNVLDYVRDRKIPRVIFASSSSVYGTLSCVPWNESLKLDQAISPYAVTKLSGEAMGYCYHHLYNIHFIALRFFTVYGPGQRPDLAIHKFFNAIYRNQPLPVYGDGNTMRDYTYISDIVDGICASIHIGNPCYEVINLGNNKPVSLNELLNAIEQVTGRNFQINRLPEQPGDVPITYADISKAKKLLQYEPKVDLMTGLHLFNEWYLAQDIFRPD